MMLRLLAVFAVLFVGTAVCISLLPSPPEVVQPPSAVAAQLRHEAGGGQARPNVRVVYPGPGAALASNETLPNPEAPPPGPTPATAAPLPASTPVSTQALYPQVPAPAPADPALAAVPANPAAQAGTPGVNLNTASIDALNQIPGAGRIGRTIASHRPYRSVEDLLTKRVVKRSVYDRIKDQVAAE